MSPAELKAVRESLGLTGEALAAYVGVHARTLRAYEQGEMVVPARVAGSVRELRQHTEQIVRDLAREIVARVGAEGSYRLVTYRTDAEYLADHPHSVMSAGWHRAVAVRVQQMVPGVSIVYADELEAM